METRGLGGFRRRDVAHFLEALRHALGQHVEGLGVRLGDELRELLRRSEALLEANFGELGVLDELLLRRTGLAQLAEESRCLLERLTSDLDLAAGQSLRAFDRQ